MAFTGSKYFKPVSGDWDPRTIVSRISADGVTVDRALLALWPANEGGEVLTVLMDGPRTLLGGLTNNDGPLVARLG